ncbi:MAG: hypothetical protein AAFP92_07635 [Bacteroidota bacterium]
MKIVFFLSLIFFHQSVACQHHRLYDLNTHEAYSIEINYEAQKEPGLIILLKNQNGILQDSLMFRNLLWGPSSNVACDHKFLTLTFPLRAGMGHYLEKLMILQVKRGKIHQAANIIHAEEYDYINIEPDFERYEVETQFDDCLDIRIIENYQLTLLDGEKRQWNMTSKVAFDPQASIFSNTQVSLINSRIVSLDRKVEGVLPALKLNRFTYVFWGKKWYLLNEQKNLVPQ